MMSHNLYLGTIEHRFSTAKSQEIDLTAALKQLGIRSIFDADKVDFSVSRQIFVLFRLLNAIF